MGMNMVTNRFVIFVVEIPKMPTPEMYLKVGSALAEKAWAKPHRKSFRRSRRSRRGRRSRPYTETTARWRRTRPTCLPYLGDEEVKAAKAFADLDKTAKLNADDPARGTALKAIDAALKDCYASF